MQRRARPPLLTADSVGRSSLVNLHSDPLRLRALPMIFRIAVLSSHEPRNVRESSGNENTRDAYKVERREGLRLRDSSSDSRGSLRAHFCVSARRSATAHWGDDIV